MVLEAVEQRIDQGFALEQLVPVRIIEIGGNDGRPLGTWLRFAHVPIR